MLAQTILFYEITKLKESEKLKKNFPAVQWLQQWGVQ